MKKKLAFVALTVLSYACSLDRISLIDFSQNTFRKPDFEKLLALKNKQEEFVIADESDQYIFTKNQNFIFIDKSSLQTKSGEDVDYPYIVIFEEFLMPKDYILNNLPTSSGNRILETAGAYNIRAFKNGEELSLKLGQVFSLNVNNNIIIDEEMGLFQGTEPDSLNTDFNWVENTTTEGIAIREGGEQISVGDREGYLYYRIFPSSLGFINIDKFNYYEGKVTENFTFLSEEPPLEAIRVYLFFESINSIMPINAAKRFPLPIGEKVLVIAMAVNQDEEYFSYFEKIKIKDGFVVNIALRPTSILELERRIDELEFPNQD